MMMYNEVNATDIATQSLNNVSNMSQANGTPICVAGNSLFENGTLSKEQADLALFLIYEIIMPIVCFVGFTGNLLSAIILFKTKDKNAFTIYLKALTLSDMVILMSGILRFICKMVRHSLKTADSTKLGAYCMLIVGFGIGNFAAQMSSFLITVMSVERFVAVVFPLRLRSFVLEKYARRVVAILFLIQVILRTPTVIWTEVASRNDCSTNATISYLEYREWSRDIVFRRVLFHVLNVIDRFIPVTTVICMNAGILITLKRRTKLNIQREATIGTMEKHKITITLVVLSMFYLITSVANSVLYILVTLAPEFTLASKEYYLFAVLIDAVIVVIALNAANDFIIYVMSSRRFRDLFRETYCGWVKRSENQLGHIEAIRVSSVTTHETSMSSCQD